MVYQANDMLKEQASDHHESNDCMVGTEQVYGDGNPNTHTHACENNHVCENHPSSVEPGEAFEAHKPHGDGT